MCGRRSFRAVDAWSGVTEATRDEQCRRCRRPPHQVQAQLGPFLLLLGLVAAPVIALLEVAGR